MISCQPVDGIEKSLIPEMPVSTVNSPPAGTRMERENSQSSREMETESSPGAAV
ncbi:MAG: hypothetical protein ACOCVC_07685 [Spirochaeta sp.]